MGIRAAIQRVLFEQSYLRAQVKKQAEPPPVPRLAPDFAPINAHLNRVTAITQTELDGRLIKGGLLAGASVGQIGQWLRDGVFTPEQLAAHYLVRIRKRDELNYRAVLHLNADALNIARDAAIPTPERPLQGIPILIKGNISTGDGMATTAGAAALNGLLAGRDATIVERLRAAGMVILGKTNLTEWANFTSSGMANGYSALGGQTVHPDGRYDVGGSSAGSAVAVRADADLAPLAIGTETTGSLTYPASMHEIVTIKPTHGLVSRDGIIPISDELDTAGPMARTVRDAAALLHVIAGEDARDPATQGFQTDDFARYCDDTALRGVRVGIVRGMYYGTGEGVERTGDAAVWARVRTVLAEAGADAFEIDFAPPPINNRPLMHAGFKLGVNAYLAAVAGAMTLADVLAFNHADPAMRVPYGQNLLEASAASTMDEGEYRAVAAANRAAARKALDEAFSANRCDALLTFANYLALYHATAGSPALTQPAGKRASGEPVGVTWLTRHGEDARAIAFGHAFEAAYGRARQMGLLQAGVLNTGKVR